MIVRPLYTHGAALNQSARYKLVFAGLSLASFAFMPALRAIFGVSDVVYFAPLIALFLLSPTFFRLREFKLPHGIVLYLVPATLLCAWLLATSTWSISSGQVTKDILLVLYLLLLMLLASIAGMEGAINWAFRWIIVAGFMTAIYVIAEYYSSAGMLGYGMRLNNHYLEISAAIGASAVGFVAHLTARRRLALPSLLVLLVIMAGLALSLGRMSLLSAVALSLFLGIYSVIKSVGKSKDIKMFAKAIGSGILMLFGAFTAFLGALQVERTAHRLGRLFGSLEQELVKGGRGALWESAWQGIGNSPWFGYGLGSSGILTSGSDGDYPHNLFLQIWLDSGIVGLILLTITLAIPIILFLCHRKAEQRDQALPFIMMYVFHVLAYQTSSNAYTARAIFLMGVLSICVLYPSPASAKMHQGNTCFPISGNAK